MLGLRIEEVHNSALEGDVHSRVIDETGTLLLGEGDGGDTDD